MLAAVYNPAFFKKAGALLDEAQAAIQVAPHSYQPYQERVAFVRAGLEFVELMTQNVHLMNKVRATSGRDAQAVRQVTENWKAIEAGKALAEKGIES